VRETGTEDLGEIAARYETERFGFASRNFYASFLAAVEVSSHTGRYFPSHHATARDRIALVTPAFMPVDVLVEGLGIDKDRLRSLNPALHHAVWNGKRFVPEGHLLQLPATIPAPWAEERLAKLAEHFGFSAQRPSRHYEVRLGDSLSEIAQRHGTSTGRLLALNRLKSADAIHAGQLLRVPRLPDPVPLGVGSAAILAAQRLDGEIGGESADLPRLIAALAGEDGPGAREERAESPGGSLEPGACPPAAGAGWAEALAHLRGSLPETGASVAAEVQPDLAADPFDYGVAPDGTIEIQIDETLGHYADWLQVRSERLKTLNRLRGDAPLIVGRRLKLDFSSVDAERFEERRFAHHRARQLRYFERHRITEVVEHPIIAGDNLWLLAVDQYRIPLWLLRQYNPDVTVDTVLSVGTVMLVPLVDELRQDATCAMRQVKADTTATGIASPLAAPGELE
jgi:membrane-bound lytic murein transglycosylase D